MTPAGPAAPSVPDVRITGDRTAQMTAPPARYEIRAEGVLGEDWSAWFDGLQAASGAPRPARLGGPPAPPPAPAAPTPGPAIWAFSCSGRTGQDAPPKRRKRLHARHTADPIDPPTTPPLGRGAPPPPHKPTRVPAA